MFLGTIELAQGKPFTGKWGRYNTDANGNPVGDALELADNAGFRMHFKDRIGGTLKLAIDSEAAEPHVARVGNEFIINVLSSVTSEISGPAKPCDWVTDIEIYYTDTGECFLDAGAYLVRWIPEITTPVTP